MSKKYKEMKEEILAEIQVIKKVIPELGEYLEKYMVFDDEKETFSFVEPKTYIID